MTGPTEASGNDRSRTFTSFDWHDDGVLWLINRVVFHPRGYALTRQRDADPEWTIQGDGTEVWTFTNEDDDKLFAAVEALFDRMHRA